ncbi:MAG: beta-galactosidase [Phycisphaerae bacterium]|jgi:beta-galactosidase
MTQPIHRYPPINSRLPHFIHGADYNPEQWADMPEVWDRDVEMMKQTGCNTMTVGVFSWVSLEPEEGVFTFGWLDTIMDKLASAGIFAVLATPSGARPAWMDRKYPEINRVGGDRHRNLHGMRQNHCMTSPVYREKCRIMNTALAQRYGNHPALSIWHVSNEYSGECHCDLCQNAFRSWLKGRYGDSLDALNKAWWTTFWSHTYTAWEQIESPSPRGERLLHGLSLDWRRYTVDQTVDFFKAEAAPLRAITPTVPVTVNMMGTHYFCDYSRFAPLVDVIANDLYPSWHQDGSDMDTAAGAAFVHDLMRSLKGGQPFMLMESTPSIVNWSNVCPLKRPGMHRLSSLQAVAHGSDTVQYFQWRKSRGASEKFHGAVVDHVGHANTRVFKDVAEVGAILGKLDAVVGTAVPAETAIFFDWENWWALEEAKFLHKDKKYVETCFAHHRPFWEAGVPTDVITEDADFSKYKLLVAPMLYMVRPGVAERIEQFVAGGGTFVATYVSGQVDQTDLCFLGGFPGPLRRVLGVWVEEDDALPDGRFNELIPLPGNALGLEKSYALTEIFEISHVDTAKVLATYGKDFYAGTPALTVNALGKGRSYYIAARSEKAFLCDFYSALIRQLGLKRAIEAALPTGVSAQIRTDGRNKFLFIMNFQPTAKTIDLGRCVYVDLISGLEVSGDIELAGYGSRVLKRAD